MFLVAATFVVLLVNMLLDLLLEKQKGRRITPKMWTLAFLVPIGVSGLVTLSGWFLKANPKIAHAPLPPWFGFGLIALFPTLFFILEVSSLCEQKRRTGDAHLKIEDDFVMGVGFVAILVTAWLWARFGFSAWFLPMVLALTWISLIALWIVSTKTVAFLVDKIFPRNQNEK